MTMNSINIFIKMEKMSLSYGHQSIVSAYNFQYVQEITSILYTFLYANKNCYNYHTTVCLFCFVSLYSQCAEYWINPDP